MNNNLHLFFKFHEDGEGEFENIKTMEEHIDVLKEKGKVVWGHFSSNASLKGLWSDKVEIMKKQKNEGAETFVFFCDKQNELLYVSRYLDSYKREEIDINHTAYEFVPKYYQHKVGRPEEIIKGEMRSYANVLIDRIIKIDYTDIHKIYADLKSGLEPVMENKGMSSKFYVKLEDDKLNS